MKDSNPTVYDASEGSLLSLSIAGAPCELNPPYSRELRSIYQGTFTFKYLPMIYVATALCNN
jgi:hypothetical protein